MNSAGRNPAGPRLEDIAPSTSKTRLLGPFGEDDLLAPTLAAEIAERSLRTIRRAYANGTLRAYRDGSGRGVRIRYGDLRDWLLREPITPTPTPKPSTERPLGRIDPARRHPAEGPSENLALLNAARERRRGSSRRAGAAELRAEDPRGSSRA
jgi:excisionase family DNA binding protein